MSNKHRTLVSLLKDEANALRSATGTTGAIVADTFPERTSKIKGEFYSGPYAATPKKVEQTLPTKGKVLADDITVAKIPYFEVTNITGGTTVYIGDK